MYNHTFARYYDRLTTNINYPAWARYYHRLIERAGGGGGILLDLACGTGGFSLELARLGYDVIGVDASPDMLSLAAEKAGRLPGISPPTFLCQKMERLNLYGTIDACVCALDSINHLPDTRALQQAFARVGLFLAPGGVFVFDVNTHHKHKNVLAGNTFVYETGDLLCLWRNDYTPKNSRVDVSLDFFTRGEGGLYQRSSESFSERIFSHRTLCGALKAADLRLIAIFGENSLSPPRKDTERVIYLAEKQFSARQ